MRKAFVPQSVIPGAKRRVDPDTLIALSDKQGRPLWEMPAPIRYAEHKKWRRNKSTGELIVDTIMVPVYRGASASYVRWVKSQIRRNQRKMAAAKAAVAALNVAEVNEHEEAQAALTDLVLNPGGHNVEEHP